MVDAPRAARDFSVRPAGAAGAPRPDPPALGRNSTRSLGGVTFVGGAVGSVGTLAVSVRGGAVGTAGRTGAAVGGTGVGRGAVRGWTGVSFGRGAGGKGAGGGKKVTRVCVRPSSSPERNRALSDTEVMETSAARNSTAVAMLDAPISVHRGERRGKSNGYVRRSAVCTGNGGRGIRTPKSFRTPVFKTGALAILPALPVSKIVGAGRARKRWTGDRRTSIPYTASRRTGPAPHIDCQQAEEPG